MLAGVTPRAEPGLGSGCLEQATAAPEFPAESRGGPRGAGLSRVVGPAACVPVQRDVQCCPEAEGWPWVPGVSGQHLLWMLQHPPGADWGGKQGDWLTELRHVSPFVSSVAFPDIKFAKSLCYGLSAQLFSLTEGPS